jgi:hypothetical protein
MARAFLFWNSITDKAHGSTRNCIEAIDRRSSGEDFGRALALLSPRSSPRNPPTLIGVVFVGNGWRPDMAGKSPRIIDVEEEDIKSDLEEEQEREGDPAPIDKLEEGDVLDEDDEVAEVEQEEE